MDNKAKIISIINQKGGVGKTNASIDLGTVFSMFDKKNTINRF